MGPGPGGRKRVGNPLHGQHADLPTDGYRNSQTDAGGTGAGSASSAGSGGTIRILLRRSLCRGGGEGDSGLRPPGKGLPLCRRNGAVSGCDDARPEHGRLSGGSGPAAGNAGAGGDAGGQACTDEPAARAGSGHRVPAAGGGCPARDPGDRGDGEDRRSLFRPDP